MELKTIDEIINEEAKLFSAPITADGMQLLLINVGNAAAKQAVEHTLEQAAENAVAKENPDDYGTGEIWVDKPSILNLKRQILNDLKL